MVTDRKVIVTKCVEYYKQWLDVKIDVNDNGTCGREVFLKGVLNPVALEMLNILDTNME